MPGPRCRSTFWTSSHVSAERDRCVGSGQCAMLSPEVFDQDDEGLVVEVVEEPAGYLPQGGPGPSACARPSRCAYSTDEPRPTAIPSA
ncbi:ferredoxin [Streptomyces sparsogenes]|uniref:ferredoxin n=1 Tax=Streptomyces sparsogenes TaxID=67365 RepID=UPI003F4D3A6D